MIHIRYFKEHEFDSPDEPGSGAKMNPDFVKKLDDLRHECGFPFIITSGYRTREHNRSVGGKDNSAHLEGRAADIAVHGERVLQIIAKAQDFGFTGIGVHQKGEYDERYVHLDDVPNSPGRPRPRCWTY